MMKPREVVRRTLTFDRPDRIAMAMPDSFPCDLCIGGIDPDPDSPGSGWEEVEPGRWQRTDQWGNVWRRLEDRTKGEVARGALEDWDRLDELSLPDFDRPDRYESARQTFRNNPDKFRVGGLGSFPFNIARKMRRMDNFLMDTAAAPERIRSLLEMIEEQLHHAIEHLAEAGADGIFFCEDWGTQSQLLVSVDTWRDLFKPGYSRLCSTAHENDMFVFMHSCGKISEAMDDMVEAGIDLFQFDQPTLHGIDWLGEHFDRRAAFWCPVDIQRTLQTQDRDVIEEEAKEMVEKLGGSGGGFMAGRYPDDAAIGLDPSVQDIACRAFIKHGAPQLWEEYRDVETPTG